MADNTWWYHTDGTAAQDGVPAHWSWEVVDAGGVVVLAGHDLRDPDVTLGGIVAAHNALAHADYDSERLSPAMLRADAEAMLSRATDPTDVVVRLLKHIREHRDEVDWVRDGYSASYDQLSRAHREVCDERNTYREAIRTIKHAVRNVKVGRL